MTIVDAEKPELGIRRSAALPPVAALAFIAAIVAVIVITIVSYRSLQASAGTAALVTRTISVLQNLETILSDAKDAETGQRGFLLTGDETYLEPLNNGRAAVFGEIESTRLLMADDSTQLHRLDALKELMTEKISELSETIDLKRAGKAEEALAVVRTDRGKVAMDHIRGLMSEMSNFERSVLARRQSDWQQAAAFSFDAVWMGAAFLLALIVFAAIMMSRDYRAREINAWIRAGLIRMNDRLRGEHRLDEIGEQIVGFLARYLNAQVGAIYTSDNHESFVRFAGYALPSGTHSASTRPVDGLVGQAARDGRVLHVQNVPPGYLPVTSAVGRGPSQELLIAPAIVDGTTQAIVELGFFGKTTRADREFLERASESLAIALRSSKDRTRLEELLEETQRQAEELQTQQEELRVNNEELEEQGRVLKESQVQLETQQAELEQTNSHLEEQTQLLETQKDNLSETQAVLAKRAEELQRVNQYKSEFLANMSHELRTPLNSTLILAKLLADNKSGNLTIEQIKFAETISSAGNDLLALINDILDLSKIEAGKIDINIEPVQMSKITADITRTFGPQAIDKGLEFHCAVDTKVPDFIRTDSQRLTQILRNLISNALKFTERGSINVRVSKSSRLNGIDISVRDSGIGIAPEQHDFIFDAFRQADGSTHRKYGGTGLGLSISRDLARLLGGEITLSSTPGSGSTFTLSLPLSYEQPVTAAVTSTPVPPADTQQSGGVPSKPGGLTVGASVIDDDRDGLSADSRSILIIEDDVYFASVLRDLVREMSFRSIVTHSASDGLAAASLYRPRAILLDMNLPDHSGLGVLDRLKHNPHTRHMPVHVISVADYSQEARELGAVGYALKPVKREELVEALRLLEAKFTQTLRRVLVVEDDERQGESIRRLLANGDVEITLVANAADAVKNLQATTFDCVVMDLNLPDMSGYALLERMAALEHVSFPPVIVYTGRNLTRDEEQALHRFSKSIIIKDARSPERLLDEVTLFLHQVESTLPAASQRLLRDARNRDETLEGRRILVVEDDVRNIFALSSVLELKGVKIEIARNGREAIEALDRAQASPATAIDLVLMDIMMPEMDGIEAMQHIRKRAQWRRLPIIALTAKAMRDDQEKCLVAGANDYIAKPLDVEKLLSLLRVWMPKI